MASPDFLLIREKETRLIDAVRENNVELLKDLLDSPKWYNTTDRWGCNLLQIAICEEKQDVIEYLLSLPDYPLEFENKLGETALEMSFQHSYQTENSENIACELIKNGARIDKIFTNGYTFLHFACKRGFINASMLLIEKGIDVNACGSNGYTPLERICSKYYLEKRENREKYDEIILMLLEFGADTSLRNEIGCTPFESYVASGESSVVQEALFYYTYDEFSFIEIHLTTLLRLAKKNSFLFYEITKRSCEIIVGKRIFEVYSFLNYLDLAYLCYSTSIVNYSETETPSKIFITQLSEINVDFFNNFPNEILDIIIEADSSKDQLINVYTPLENSNRSTIFYQGKLEHLIKFIFYALSCGIEIDGNTLHSIYNEFGYCELFKMLLHMDFRKESRSCCFCVLPTLLINPTESLVDCLKNYENISRHQLKELMSYFADHRLHCLYKYSQAIPEDNINFPKVPSLLELSRNVFRSYFINKFHIETSSQFYTFLNCLKINPFYKKIISYETKLYSP